jgi:hypothetical protein
MNCVICGNQIRELTGGKLTNSFVEAFSHNADPVATGRCCGVCNDTKVIPERLALASRQGDVFFYGFGKRRQGNA